PARTRRLPTWPLRHAPPITPSTNSKPATCKLLMNRREALAALSTVLGGTIIGAQAFLAGCATPTLESTEPAFVGMLGEADVALLNEIGETILPTTPGSPGAGAANVGAFMNVMVTDCYGPEEQQ